MERLPVRDENSHRTVSSTSAQPGIVNVTENKVNRKKSEVNIVESPQLVNRSIMGKEFGISNKNGSLNCFLNVALQALWACPSNRSKLEMFCQQREQGPTEMKPLMNALQDFFSEVLPKEGADNKVRILDSGLIHNEIFKLHYLTGEGEFTLNRKADSFEVLDFIITCMHTWMQACAGKQLPDVDPDWEKSIKVAMMSSISCDRNEEIPCFIHDVYYL